MPQVVPLGSFARGFFGSFGAMPLWSSGSFGAKPLQNNFRDAVRQGVYALPLKTDRRCELQHSHCELSSDHLAHWGTGRALPKQKNLAGMVHPRD